MTMLCPALLHVPCGCRIARVRVSATLIAVEGIVQWINLVFYAAPNVYLLRKPCYLLSPFVYASGFVQWTCWNTVRLRSALQLCLSGLLDLSGAA